MAYAELDPFGAQRDNYHAAIIAATLANLHRKPGTRAIGTDEFMLMDPQDRKARETRQTLAMLSAMAKKD